MERISAAFLVLLAACSAPLDATISEPDAGARTIAPDDAGEPVLDSDSGAPDATLVVLEDAGAPGPDETDAGAPTRLQDAGSPPDDAEPVLPSPDAATGHDAGAARVDAGSPPSCARDGFEANDDATSAPWVASTTSGWTARYDLTWHDDDPADWIAGELGRSGAPSSFRVTAVDSDWLSDVEVRVRCLAGVVYCAGPGARRSGDTCSASRREIIYLDVGCGAVDSPLEVRVGSTRSSASALCEHSVRVSVEPTPAP